MTKASGSIDEKLSICILHANSPFAYVCNKYINIWLFVPQQTAIILIENNSSSIRIFEYFDITQRMYTLALLFTAQEYTTGKLY